MHQYSYSLLSATEAGYFLPFCLPQHRYRFPEIGVGRDKKVLAVGAHAVHLPFGLALVQVDRSGETADLLSIVTKEGHRHRGIATEMIRRLKGELRERECKYLRVLYEEGRPYAEDLKRFLAHVGFPAGEVYAIACRCVYNKMTRAPWIKERVVPSAFELFLWKDLTPQDESSIKERQRTASWFPEELSPFTDNPMLEPMNSLGLRYNGEVIGWQINLRIQEDTIQYCITFVREDLQPLGLGVLLMTESTRIQLMNSDSGVNKAYFKVPLAMKGMIGYIEKRLAPYIDYINECVKTQISL